MISENLNLDPENPTVTMRECLDIAKSDFMDALFDKILEGTFFCA
ncbi:hypothetical protein [Blautia sp. 1033sp1_1033st1_G9_1033SCRN_220408]